MAETATSAIHGDDGGGAHSACHLTVTTALTLKPAGVNDLPTTHDGQTQLTRCQESSAGTLSRTA